MFVVGTAGHIDHGKSTLVMALTGIDPDRLREEKERGMTIDLGFAWLKLPGGQEVGIVDVPGHERLVKNMLAGVGGIDIAMLVVAANEGVMPQTREHTAILDLMGVNKGVVALTKADLVDQDLLGVVVMEVEELLAPTLLRGSPVVPVSPVTGIGLPELVATLDRIVRSSELRKDLGRPRLPVDRVFTVAGVGTVVTGTLTEGILTVGQEVELLPAGVKSRLRGLQTHKAAVEVAHPGSRVAANLVGVPTSQVKRGDVLTRPGWLTPVKLLNVSLRILPSARLSLRHNTTVSFHSGTAEQMARVRLLEKDEVAPGETSWAQVLLTSPAAIVSGDRFVIRSTMETIGGGEVVSVDSKRLKRRRPSVIAGLEIRRHGSPDDSVLAALERQQPVEMRTFVTGFHLPATETGPVVDDLLRQGRIISIGEDDRRLLLTVSGWQRLVRDLVVVVGEYHRRYPARVGMPKAELSGRLKLGGHSPAVFRKLSEDKVIVEKGATVRSPSHEPRLGIEQQKNVDGFLRALAQSPYAPSGEITLEGDLLNLLVEQGKVVKVGNGVVLDATAYQKMVAGVVARIGQNGKVTLAEVRDLFGTSRKYAQAFLEHLDEKKVTRRMGDERVLWRS